MLATMTVCEFLNFFFFLNSLDYSDIINFAQQMSCADSENFSGVGGGGSEE